MQVIQDQMPVFDFAEGVAKVISLALHNKDFWRPTRIPVVSSTRLLRVFPR